jgi:hypothetical protein
MRRTIAKATLVAGTLDILFAIGLAIYFGRGPMNMLRNVASGPIPPATEWGIAGSVLGLAVHFVLMAIMVAAFVKFAQLRPAILETPIRWGVAYGVITYFAMNWVVLPLRFDSPLPPNSRAIMNQLFAHIVLVGIPIALIAARNLRPRSIA